MEGEHVTRKARLSQRLYMHQSGGAQMRDDRAWYWREGGYPGLTHVAIPKFRNLASLTFITTTSTSTFHQPMH